MMTTPERGMRKIYYEGNSYIIYILVTSKGKVVFKHAKSVDGKFHFFSSR